MNNDSYPVNQPYQPSYAPQPNATQANPYAYGPQPAGQPTQPGQAPIKSSPILTVLTILFGLGTVIFVVLFAWMAARYGEVSSDVDKQIKDATVAAIDENTKKLETDFAEREKTPNRTFPGPVDYGEVTFEYPKTWSVYQYANASNGGDFGANFHPWVVDSANDKYALRFVINNRNYDTLISDLQKSISEGKITMDLRQINGVNTNFYIGELRDGIYGAMVVIKIRDKTAIIQTDIYSVYGNDFEALLKTVRYNA